MNFFERIAVNYSILSKSEKIVCDKIMDDSDPIINFSVSEAAKRYNVSESSIVRFSKRVGYSGYSQLKYDLLHEFENNDSSMVTKESDLENWFSVYSLMVKNLFTPEMETAINAIISLLNTYDKIYTIGLGNTSLAASQLVYSLNKFEKEINLIDSQTRMNQLSTIVTDRHLIIAYSVSAVPEAVQNLLRATQKCGGETVIITMNPNGPAAKYANHVLSLRPYQFVNSQDYKTLYKSDGRSMMYIISDIISNYYNLNKDKAE